MQVKAATGSICTFKNISFLMVSKAFSFSLDSHAIQNTDNLQDLYPISKFYQHKDCDCNTCLKCLYIIYIR